MSSVQVKNICGLSPVQEGMYFHYLMTRPGDPYVIQSQYELEGLVDPTRLKGAFDQLVDRHDSLRTLFMHQKTPDPVQIILNKRETPFEFHDLTDHSDPESIIHEYLKSDRIKGFDLSRDPLVRLALFRIGEKLYRLVMTLHHIILDGWSSGVIENELFQVYAGDEFAGDTLKRPPVSFVDYIKWLKDQPHKDGIEYFKKIIPSDVNVNPHINGIKPADERVTGTLKTISHIDIETTRQLKSLAIEQQVTLSDLLRVAWYLCTSKITGSDRFTSLHTVSGRPAELLGASDMVGMFINAIVQPTTISDQSIVEFLREHHRQFAESLTWQHVSMSDVAKSVGVHSELADSLIVFENYPELGEERAALEAIMGFRFKSLSSEESTNYPVTIQFHIDKTVEVRLFLKKDWFNATDAEKFELAFNEVVKEITRDPFQSVMKFLPKRNPELPADKISVYISSNFTDTSITPYLEWWLKAAGFTPDFTISDYNSVIQNTMSSESPLFTHPGPAIILLKVLDLARFRHDLSGEGLEKYLIDTISVITDNLKRNAGSLPLCVALTPEQPELVENLTKTRYDRVNLHLQTKLSSLEHISLLDLRQTHLSIGDLFDTTSNEIGHIPYTEAGYSFLASQIARKLRAWKYQPFKVIVLDADNTLWHGVLGEDGIEGIKITEAHKMLQEFMLARRNEGFLLALCTKNNKPDVDELFTTRSDMVLKASDFVSVKANWNPKSGNIKEIAQELNLGLDSFVFLDDSSLEIEEVRSEIPDVFALKLPEETSTWKLFLNHLWAFDTYKVTKEDRDRTQMYQAESKRREIAQKHDQQDDFITQLNVKTEFIIAQEELLPRIEQLTQRTNQFNLNGRRFTVINVKSYMAQPDQYVFALSVSDQFGEYGLTGALFIRIESEILHIDAWMLSCRVLSRGVEHLVIHFLSTFAAQNGATKIRFHHTKTPKNNPIQQFLSGELFKIVPVSDDISFIDFICSSAEMIPAIGLYDLVDTLKPSQEHPVLNDANRQMMSAKNSVENSNEDVYNLLPEVYSTEHTRNKRYLIGINNLHPIKLQNCRSIISHKIPASLTAYAEPISQTEHELAVIWRELLDATIVGRNDDFFDLGGNSLMATRLASKIYRTFDIDIDLKTFFENTILHQVAKIIDRRVSDMSQPPLEDIKVLQADSYPLSDSQHRIWRSEQVFDASAGYILGGAYRIVGDFDINRLSDAIQELTNKHSALRTYFPLINGEPRQVIHNTVNVPIQSLSIPDTADDQMKVIEEFFTTRFNLETGPLVAFAFQNNSSNDHILAIKIHHLVTDGWSQGIIMQQLVDLYLNGSEEKQESDSTTVRFVDFVHWQKNQVESRQSEWNSFWETELSDAYERFELPLDYPRPPAINKSTQQLSVSVDAGLRAKVDAFSRKNQLSLYMTMMASVHLLFQKYTGNSDTIIGSPFSGRTHPSVQDTVGFFVNTLPFRMKSQSEQSLTSWIQEVRNKTLQLLHFQNVSLDTILNHLNITESDNRPPLFDVLVLVQEEPESDESKTTGLSISPLSSEHLGAGYDIVFQIFSSRNTWRLIIEYQPELFHQRTISAMGEHWKAVLQNISDAGDMTLVSKISASNNEIKDTLKRIGRGAKRDYPDQTLLDVFESASLRRPQSIALIDEKNRETTYQELDLLSTSVARKLINRGIHPGDRVIVNTELKSNAILLMLALFKCRAIYVPVDSETPLSRLDYIMETCGPVYRIIDVSVESGSTGTSHQYQLPVLSVRELIDDPLTEIVELPEGGDSGESAYIIFTSGSTGRPKGVEVHHRGLVNMVHTISRQCEINESDRILCFASISFDASLSEIIMGFMPGATIVCPDNSIKKDAAEFMDYINRMKISVITLPPVFLASLNRPEMPYIRSIITAGEAARKSDALHYARNKRYVNAYGPTECSVGSNAHLVQSDGSYPTGIPIGNAFDNVQLAVLDKNLELAPFGATGQLAINGIQVAKGYFGRPDLTEKVFIQHPEFDERTYLTGDLVRWNAHGQLEFLGRNDNQVKVRGYRIELDEIKYQLEQIPGIIFSHVHVLSDSQGEKQIITWVVEAYPVSDDELRFGLLKNLPNYMIPSRFIRVPEIKLTINGKVDLKSLPNPFTTASTLKAPTYTGDNPQLKLLSDAFNIYLTGSIDLTTSFTKNGGDSIKAIQITNYLKQHGYQIRAGLLYEVAKLEELAEHIHIQVQSSGRPVLVPGIILCTPIQQWFFHEVKDREKRNLFWMQAGFILEQALSKDSISQMINELVEHHEIFRIRFNLDFTTPKVVVESKPLVNIQILDGESLDFNAQLNKYHKSLNQVIDFEQGPIAALLVVQKHNSTKVLCVVHHLVIDAMSLRLIRDQLQWMLGQLQKGESPSLDTGYITHQQWINRCQSILCDSGHETEKEYWNSVYSMINSNFEIESINTKSQVHTLKLSQEKSAKLLDICKIADQKLEHVLLATCVKAIKDFTGLESFSIDIESQGRESLGRTMDIGTTLGWFTTEYPILISSINQLPDLITEVATQTNRIKSDGLGAVIARNKLFESGLHPKKADLGFNYLGQFNSNNNTQNEWQWDDSLIFDNNGFSHKWHPLELSALVENGSIKIRLQSNTPSVDQNGLENILSLTEESLSKMASSVEDDTRPIIVFFPFVASNASFFETLKMQLEPEYKVVVLELPGHGKRIDEPFAETIEMACDDLLQQIRFSGPQKEHIFWLGHSMGAYLGSACLEFMAARKMRLPTGFLISDVAAPGQFDAWIVGDMTPSQRSEYYSRMGYDVLMNSLESSTKAHAEELIRQDLKLVRHFVNPNQPQITIPVHFLYSKSESEMFKNEWIQGWQAICLHDIECSAFEGGHIEWLDNAQNTGVIKNWIRSIFQYDKFEI